MEPGGRVAAALDAALGEFRREPFGGERGGAGDDDLPAGGLVRASDAGQCGALPGSGLAFDHHERVLAAREPDRLCAAPLTAGHRPWRVRGRAGRSRVATASSGSVPPGRRQALGDRDDGPFAAAVIAGRAGPVGEQQDLTGLTQHLKLPSASSIGCAGGLFERDRARFAGGERRVELRQRLKHHLRVGRLSVDALVCAEDFDTLAADSRLHGSACVAIRGRGRWR